jgi:hypothetical protein
MQRLSFLFIAVGLTGCAGAPLLAPYTAAPLVPSLADACPTATPGTVDLVPEGLVVFRSDATENLMVAAGRCSLTVDTGSGRADPLTLRSEIAAPTMLDATAEGVALASLSTGAALRIYFGEETTTVETMTGLGQPRGIRLLPGGGLLVSEFEPGRILRIGPSMDSRPVTVIEQLDGPVSIVVASAVTAYVSERNAGRITRFSLRSGERATVATGLAQPEGIALLPDRRIAVAETGMRRIVAIDPKSGAREVLAENLPVSDDPWTVTDLAVGSDGAIFVSSDLERTIYRLTRRP